MSVFITLHTCKAGCVCIYYTTHMQGWLCLYLLHYTHARLVVSVFITLHTCKAGCVCIYYTTHMQGWLCLYLLHYTHARLVVSVFIHPLTFCGSSYLLSYEQSVTLPLKYLDPTSLRYLLVGELLLCPCLLIPNIDRTLQAER